MADGNLRQTAVPIISIARKHTTSAKCGKTRENMQPVPSAGKHATCANGGEKCNLVQARENVTCAKREKTCNLYQARENIQPVPNAKNKQTSEQTNKQQTIIEKK